MADIDEDLVLHEGDGKIRRPSKLVSGSKIEKIKCMPSPRKLKTATVVTSTTMIGIDNNNNNSSNSTSNLNDNNRAKTEELFEQIRRNSNLVAPNTFFDESDEDDASMLFDDENDDNLNLNNNNIDCGTMKERSSPNEPTNEDLEIYQRLDDEYERALEERDIGYNARYASVRQTAMWSVLFLIVYMVQGTICYRELLWLNYNRNIQHTAGEEEFDADFRKWSLPESLFFSIFTITTVGYGREDLPTTAGFQAYTIFYILIGIAALTIMVAQVFQCIALEASRARLSQDKTTELRRRSGLMISNDDLRRTNHTRVASAATSAKTPISSTSNKQHNDPNSSADIIIPHTDAGCASNTMDHLFRCVDSAKYFFRNTEIGRGISVIFPFAGLILSGALVVGPLEQWSFLESLYFAVVSLTTVGFGDYVPTELASIWFCIFWLPFSIGFMSLYLGNIAHFYIRLNDKNIRRIERRLRRRLQKAKEKAEEERAVVLQRAYRGQEADIELMAATKHLRVPDEIDSGNLNDGREDIPGIPMNHVRSVMSRKTKKVRQLAGFDILPSSESDSCGSDNESDILSGSSTHVIEYASAVDAGHKRRQRIIENCRVVSLDRNDDNNDRSEDRTNDPSMKSMQDVICAVRNTINSKDNDVKGVDTNSNNSHFMTIQSTQNMIDYSMFRRRKSKKPSFALRVLIQERFAKIIATEVAGYHSSVEIKDHTLSVTIDTLSDTADKWSIPRRARKAFRSVGLEVLYFVGEHSLITRGAEALYELTPFEFHGLFSSLVATMGDADTMEAWLAKTENLARVDLELGVLKRSAPELSSDNDRDRTPRQRVLS